MAHTHQQPALDGLTVPASLAMARGTAEMNSGEIGSVHIEQRQRRVAVGPAGSVSGMVPAYAGADVVTETPELALSTDESAQIAGMGEDGVRGGVSEPAGVAEHAVGGGKP